MDLNTVIIICVILFTLTVIVTAVFLIRALIQVKNTAGELEEALQKVNKEIDVISEISDKISGITKTLSSPVVAAVSALTTAFFRKKSRCSQEEE